MTDFEKLLERYHYAFPKRLIAQKPASPRDSARLLIYRRACRSGGMASKRRAHDEVSYDRFLNLPSFLPRSAVLVFNETKVIPARLTVLKETGGLVRLLFLGKLGKRGPLKVMADRKLIIGNRIFLNQKIFFTVARQKEKYYFLEPSFPVSRLEKILEQSGQTPIPPYIKHSPFSETELREKYQTVFARNRGSVAAPTASLHFTKRLILKLKQSGHQTEFVTLHVNLGTFAPVTPENLAQGRLHKEFYEIPPATARVLNKAKKDGRPIIAVGTTVVRTLESALTSSSRDGRIRKLSGTTDLFIRPGYHFKFVDGLITNFHVPRSSLMMLVSAFVGREKLLELCQKAIAKKFQLFSFGDGMLIL